MNKFHLEEDEISSSGYSLKVGDADDKVFATSSIDTRTESLVHDGMDRLMQGRTTFVIAHRFSPLLKDQKKLLLYINPRMTMRNNIEAK